MMGYSRDTFYRFKELYDKRGEIALQETSRRKPILKNPVGARRRDRGRRHGDRTTGVRTGLRLQRTLRRGVIVLPFGVRSIWLRHDLATMKTG
jgi:hypothetical protein